MIEYRVTVHVYDRRVTLQMFKRLQAAIEFARTLTGPGRVEVLEDSASGLVVKWTDTEGAL